MVCVECADRSGGLACCHCRIRVRLWHQSLASGSVTRDRSAAAADRVGCYLRACVHTGLQMADTRTAAVRSLADLDLGGAALWPGWCQCESDVDHVLRDLEYRPRRGLSFRFARRKHPCAADIRPVYCV